MILIFLKDSRALSRRPIDFRGSFFLSGSILFLMSGLNIIVNDSGMFIA